MDMSKAAAGLLLTPWCLHCLCADAVDSNLALGSKISTASRMLRQKMGSHASA